MHEKIMLEKRLQDPRMEYYHYTYRNSVRYTSEDLNGKTAVIYCEQGFGDIIQFLRYIPALNERGCKSILHIPSELHRVAATIPGVIGLIDKVPDLVLPPHDFHILTLDLPIVLGEDTEMPPPYIDIKTKKEVNDSNYKIGICWEANGKHEKGLARSLPLSFFKSLDREGIHLYALQNEIHHKPDCNLQLFSWPLHDFYDTAELINAMDLLITVDTAVLHLIGAMAKPGIVVCPNKADERWWFAKKLYPNLLFVKSNEVDFSKMLNI